MARKLILPTVPRPPKPPPPPILDRRLEPSPGALYLMFLREQMTKIPAPPSGARLEISAENNAEIAEPVKIKKMD